MPFVLEPPQVEETPPRGRFVLEPPPTAPRDKGYLGTLIDIPRMLDAPATSLVSGRPISEVNRRELRLGEAIAERLTEAGFPEMRVPGFGARPDPTKPRSQAPPFFPGFSIRDAVALAGEMANPTNPLNWIGTGQIPRLLRRTGLPGVARAAEQVVPATQAAVKKGGVAVTEAVGRGLQEVTSPASFLGKKADVLATAGKRFETSEALKPIVRQRRIAEGQGIIRTKDFVRQMQKDLREVAGDRAPALNETVGRYFDAGMDRTIAELKGGAEPRLAYYSGRADQDALLRNLRDGLPPEEFNVVSKYITAETVRQEKLADGLVRVGMLKPETRELYRNMHMRRGYERYLHPEDWAERLKQLNEQGASALLADIEGAAARGFTGPTGTAPSGVTKPRKPFSPERARLLGQVDAADVRILHGDAMAEQAIARGDAFAEIARQFARDPKDLEAVGLSNLYRPMPNDPARWGKLAGQSVPKEVFDMLIDSYRKPSDWQKMVGYWKMLKISNWPTISRNVRTNVSLMHNEFGLPALDPRTWIQAMKEWVEEGPMLREARNYSPTFHTSNIQQELAALGRGLTADPEKKWAYYVKQAALPTEAYSGSEQIGRLATYITARKAGKTPEQAALIAERVLFDYGDVPPWVQALRTKGWYPFITWPYKVATETLPRTIQRPGRMAQQFKAIQAFGDRYTEEEQRSLPPDWRGRGIKTKLAPNGKPVLFDLGYELAFGDVAETGTPLGQVALMLQGKIPVTEAVMTALTPFGQVLAEIAMNKSFFTQQPIRREEEPNVTPYIRHALRFASPGALFATAETAAAKTGLLERANLTPSSTLARAFTDTPSPFGAEAPSRGLALASTFAGLRTRPLDVEAEQGARHREFERERNKLRQAIHNVERSADAGAISPPLAARRIANLERKIEELEAIFERTGAAPRR